MSKKILGFESYWSFQGRYAVIKNIKMGSHQFNQIIGYKNLEELKKKVEPHSFRVTKDEALDLPPKIYTTRQVDLTMEQERYYQSIKKTSVALLRKWRDGYNTRGYDTAFETTTVIMWLSCYR